MSSVFDRLYKNHTASSRAKRQPGTTEPVDFTTASHSTITATTSREVKKMQSSTSTNASPPQIKTQTTKDSLLQSPGSPTGGDDATDMEEDHSSAGGSGS